MINSAPVFTRVKLSPASSSRLSGYLSRVTLYTEAEKSHGDRFHYLFFQWEGRYVYALDKNDSQDWGELGSKELRSIEVRRECENLCERFFVKSCLRRASII